MVVRSLSIDENLYLAVRHTGSVMAGRRVSDLGEAAVVGMVTRAFGIQELEDAAMLEIAGKPLFLSCDTMIQSTDLPSNVNPLFWGHRFVASNVSDILSMGCRPVAMLVSMGLPKDLEVRTLEVMTNGMKWACREAGLRIIGGDTNQASEIVLSGFVAGTPFSRPFKRSGARPGDLLFATGNPGSAALGLALITRHKETYFESPDILEDKVEGSSVPIGSFLAPEIRIREAKTLSELGYVTSCIDISDGLSTDAWHIAERSRVMITIEEDLIPLPSKSRAIAKKLHLDPVRLALDGGDDYELMFTAPPNAEDSIVAEKLATKIGRVEEGLGVRIRRPDGSLETLKSRGYQHFGGEN